MTSQSGATALEPREYSKRLGAITGAQLQAALDRFDLGQLVDAEPAPGGLFGQNIMLTATSGRWILRGHPHYNGQFEKEAFFYRTIVERTKARAPWPMMIEKSSRIFGWSFALMPRIPGIQLHDPDVRNRLSKDDRADIAGAMGRYLALIHDATWDTSMVYSYASNDLVQMPGGHTNWVLAAMRERLDQCRRYPETSAGDVAWVESIIAAAQEALDRPFAATLVHTDYAEGNVVAERLDDRWEICGVFDAGEMYVGDGEYDLARLATYYGMVKPPILREFIEPYFAARPPRPGVVERMALYILADRLIIWEYGHRNNVWFTPEQHPSLRGWAEPIVELSKQFG